MEKAAKKIQENINDVVKNIKTNENIRAKDMERYHQTLVDQINNELANVKSKVLISFNTIYVLCVTRILYKIYISRVQNNFFFDF